MDSGSRKTAREVDCGEKRGRGARGFNCEVCAAGDRVGEEEEAYGRDWKKNGCDTEGLCVVRALMIVAAVVLHLRAFYTAPIEMAIPMLFFTPPLPTESTTFQLLGNTLWSDVEIETFCSSW